MGSIFSRQFREGSRPIARLSGGRGGRAALLLVGIHLGVVVVACAIWAAALPLVDPDVRLLPRIAAVVIDVPLAFAAMLWLGGWGVGAASGQGWGENYADTFRVRTAVGLGFLRWFLQIVMVGVCFLAAVFTWMNARPFVLIGTDEIRSLPGRAERMPVPPEWHLLGTEKHDDGGIPTPNGSYELEYAVPEGTRFDEMRAWLTGSGWDAAFGDVGRMALQWCDPEEGSCSAQVRPASHEPAEFFVRARTRERYDGQSQIEVQLSYQQYVAPDLDVSGALKDQLNRVPAEESWVSYDSDGEKTDSGEVAHLRFGVPGDFGRDDLEAWMASSAWARPREGKPFGAIELDRPCADVLEDGQWSCHAHVVGTYPHRAGRPVLLVSARLDEERGTLSVGVERNG